MSIAPRESSYAIRADEFQKLRLPQSRDEVDERTGVPLSSICGMRCGVARGAQEYGAAKGRWLDRMFAVSPVALPPRPVLCLRKRGGQSAICDRSWKSGLGDPFLLCERLNTLNKVLELELQRFENITLKDAAGRAVDLDELTAQYEASENRG